uniref:MFS domain-containing protein n=1 Tax=Macrostomum lignano TaxID=282301 RepID=A0A1I8J028_9PLAT
MSAIYASVQLLCIGFIRKKPEARSQSGSDQQAGEGTMLIDESGTAQAAQKPDSPIPASEEAQEVAATQWTLQSAVQSLPFFVMGLSIFFLTPASIVLPSLDKAYGETFISNDMLLSVMAGIGGAFNAFGRLVAGIVIDRLHFRVCVLIQGLLLAALHALTPLSALTHPALYFILVCSVNFVFAGVFVFFPYSVEKLYGSALFAQVYGLVFLFKAVAGALIAAVTTAGLGALGWTGILVLTAVTSGIAQTEAKTEELLISMTDFLVESASLPASTRAKLLLMKVLLKLRMSSTNAFQNMLTAETLAVGGQSGKFNNNNEILKGDGF